MKKINFLLALLLSLAFFTPVTVNATDKDFKSYVGWTEIEKFDYLSEKIDYEIEDGKISIGELTQILLPINIDEFIKETGNSYKSKVDLVKEIYSQIDKYVKVKKSDSMQLMATTTTIIEGGLNYSIEGWNYYGSFMDTNNSVAFTYKLGQIKEEYTLYGVLTAALLSLVAPFATAATVIVSGWNLYTMGSVINTLNYCNNQNPYGTYVSRNKFTNSYVARKQIPGQIVTAGPYSGGGHW
jgi:hypothetical protein